MCALPLVPNIKFFFPSNWHSFFDFLSAILDPITCPLAAENDLVYVHYMAYFLIGLGAVINIIALFGCCGAIKESRYSVPPDCKSNVVNNTGK